MWLCVTVARTLRKKTNPRMQHIGVWKGAQQGKVYAQPDLVQGFGVSQDTVLQLRVCGLTPCCLCMQQTSVSGLPTYCEEGFEVLRLLSRDVLCCG